MVIYFTVQLIALIIIDVLQIASSEKVFGIFQVLPSFVNLVVLTALCLKKKFPAQKKDELFALSFVTIFFADFFLCHLSTVCFTGFNTCMGYALFSVTEILFAIWLGLNKKNIAVRIVTYAAMVILFTAVGMMSFANAIAVLNLSLLLINTVNSWQKDVYRDFRLGITCFAGCDYSILIRTFLKNDTVAYCFVTDFVWLCYVACLGLLMKNYIKLCSDKKR